VISKSGKKAYIYDKIHGSREIFVNEVTVVKVGRKYVSTTENPEWNIELDRFYVGNEENGYLNEQRDCGTCKKLFASKEDMYDYETKEKIVAYLEQTFL
jgi:hypothetical protein